MHPYPHVYRVSARGGSGGTVATAAAGLPELPITSPPQFGGPEGYWSPETLLCAAVADCFILTFRALARAARFDWLTLECQVEGVLERVEGVTQFSRFDTVARLAVADGEDRAKARKLLESAEHGCLISNSLRGRRSLELTVTTAEPAVTE